MEVALQRAGVTADRAVFVGDTIWDIRAATRAGVSCVCVRSGGIARHELEAEGASAVFDNPRQLLEELATTPIAALTAGAGGPDDIGGAGRLTFDEMQRVDAALRLVLGL